MRKTNHDPTRQFGLTALLSEAEAANQARRFERETAHLPATLREGEVPLWGQVGRFVVETCGMRARIETRGLFGVCGHASFNTHAVDLDRPFLSETGFRSFLGYGPGDTPGLTVDAYVRPIIEGHVKAELHGRLLPIAPYYRRQEG